MKTGKNIGNGHSSKDKNISNWEHFLKEDYITWRMTTAVSLPDHLYKWLKESCWKAKEKNKVKYNSKLVGHIKEEYGLPLGDNMEFENYMINASAAGPTNEWYSKWTFNTDDRPIVMENIWCNFQKKHEFNPPHTHSGVVSFVIFVQIPYDLEEEDKVYPDLNKDDDEVQLCTSRFQLINGDGQGVKCDSVPVDKSFEGKALMFPSNQHHMVFPFYTSDDYRITVSGNLRYRV